MSGYKRKNAVMLPLKASALLRIAVDDAKKVARDSRYKFDMNVWHEPNGKCSVCMAGAVMAMTLKAPRTLQLTTGHYDEHNGRALVAINSLRVGAIELALWSLDGSDALVDKRLAVREASDLIRDNYDDRLSRAPWRIYLRAADILERAGL